MKHVRKTNWGSFFQDYRDATHIKKYFPPLRSQVFFRDHWAKCEICAEFHLRPLPLTQVLFTVCPQHSTTCKMKHSAFAKTDNTIKITTTSWTLDYIKVPTALKARRLLQIDSSNNIKSQCKLLWTEEGPVCQIWQEIEQQIHCAELQHVKKRKHRYSLWWSSQGSNPLLERCTAVAYHWYHDLYGYRNQSCWTVLAWSSGSLPYP